MATVALAPRLRPRPSLGPALGRVPVPLGTIVVSALGHIAIIAAMIVGAGVWKAQQPKTYVVNLVPAVAAIGMPQGRTSSPAVPSLPPRVVEPQPRAAKAPANELPRREAPREPLPPPDMPSRERSRDTVALPDRSLSPRGPGLPRPGDKELPPVASASPPRPARIPATTSPAPVTARREPAGAPPPPPLGRPSGSPQGTGALTLDVGDFPFAWYLQTIQRKITQNWMPPAQTPEGQHAVAVFEIGRNGQVLRWSIETRSGDVLYDQAALRAIAASTPFPELPAEFKEPLLRVHLGFTYAGGRG